MNKVIFGTFIGYIIILCLITGCDSRPLTEAPVPAPGPGADLVAMGRIFLWAGGISLGLGLALRLALLISFANPITAILGKIPGIAGIITLVAESGAVAIACGLAFIWLGQNLWVLVCSLILAGLAFTAYHRDDIRRWLVSWKTYTS